MDGSRRAIVVLFSLANILESYSLERTRRAIRSLLELSPQEATVKRGEVETTVPVEEVRLGETIIIYPGAKIPPGRGGSRREFHGKPGSHNGRVDTG